MNGNIPTVTIVVAVYNVEPYLRQCLYALFGQTYCDNIEYIIVNDASTDDSGMLLSKTAEENKSLNIKIITNEKNEGLANSRTKAIACATGEYLMCCDGDDWIDIDMTEQMVKCAMENDADIVVTPFVFEREQDKTYYRFAKREKDPGDINDIPCDGQHYSLCNKLIKRTLITDNDLKPLPGTDCWEDLAVTCRALAISSKTVLLNKPMYHYRRGISSLTSSGHKKILEDHLKYAAWLDEWFKNKGESFYKKYEKFLDYLKFCAKIKLMRGDTLEVTRWKETFSEVNPKVMSFHYVPMCYRIAFEILHLLPTEWAKKTFRLTGRKVE